MRARNVQHITTAHLREFCILIVIRGVFHLIARGEVRPRFMWFSLISQDALLRFSNSFIRYDHRNLFIEETNDAENNSATFTSFNSVVQIKRYTLWSIILYNARILYFFRACHQLLS